jgi:hypothetical protein
MSSLLVQVRDDGLTFPWDPSESFGAACSQPSLLNNVSALLAAWCGGPRPFSRFRFVLETESICQDRLGTDVGNVEKDTRFCRRPGAEGGPALFNLLGGAVNPSAHLSVAWPRSVGGIGSQVPYLQQFALHYREQYQDEPTTPLFRFGYGKRHQSSYACPEPVSVNVRGLV